MDQNTKFLIERMDANHREVMAECKDIRKEISGLQALKNKILGVAAVVGGIGSLIIETLKKNLS